MNKIIGSFLDVHKKEYAIESWSTEDAFEHFIDKCIVNKYSNERFDPSEIMTDPGEKGLDGVAICVNGRVITSIDELESIHKESKTLEVRFIFIQSKTSESFDGDEMGTFIYGVKAFFAEEHLRPKTNEKMENLIRVKDKVYEFSVDMPIAPVLDLYYVCCGKWDSTNGLQARIDLDIKPLMDTQDFSTVSFFPYDSEKIILSYKELKKKLVVPLLWKRRSRFKILRG